MIAVFCGTTREQVAGPAISSQLLTGAVLNFTKRCRPGAEGLLGETDPHQAGSL
ncbi:MAG: hypothetical protein M3Y57_09985 [Acidobacteriota bacterium]|nr:hypothetical protein [Acidobacteriota bacterium]